MPYNPKRHHRCSHRLKGYDYTAYGFYFVTICTYQRQHLFGEIQKGQMILSTIGTVAQAHWQRLPRHFPELILDAFVMMPDHMHGILIIGGDRAIHASSLRSPECTDDDLRAMDFANHSSDDPINSGPNASSPRSPDDVRATHFVSHPSDDPINSSQNASPLRSPECPDDDLRAMHFMNYPSDNPINSGPNASSPRSPQRPNGPKSKSLGEIVGNYKSVSTRQINRLRKAKGTPVWQRDYHDRIIRNEVALERIRAYIVANPKAWDKKGV
ncbi:MAG: hypothetical protein AAGE59_23180 [Cyanobacteria bacterium P01_F01_bin.86]